MAICTTFYIQGGRSYLIANGVTDPSACPGQVVLSSTEYDQWLAQQSLWGWDRASVELGVSGIFLMWGVGLGVGLLLGIVRKARIT